MRSILRFSTAALVALTPALARAGVVTGHLVDSNGNPVASALIAAQPASGGTVPIVSGGFTNANGHFTATISPDGSYRLIVYPPPPPTSLVVTTIVEDVVVGISPTSLGTRVCEVGELMTGRVVNTSGTPLVSVGLEFVSPPGAQPRDFTYGDTNAGGYFQVAVPHGSCEVRFKPGPVPYYGGPNTAPTSDSWYVTGPIHAGNIVMPIGYPVSGTVIASSGAGAIEDAEIELVDLSTGKAIYMPENRTNEFGGFALPVPSGTYDLHVVPHGNDGYCTSVVRDLTVPPGTGLGTIALDEGFELRGRVRDGNNGNCVSASVQLVDSVTNLSVQVADNLTDDGGHYRMFVPAGIYDLRFSAPFSEPLGESVAADVLIDDDLDVDVVLPDVAFFDLIGIGTPGSGGIVPTIEAIGGTPRLGNANYAVRVSTGLGRGLAYASISLSGTPQGPFAGSGGQYFGHQFHLVRLDGPVGSAGTGSAVLPVPIGTSSSLVGQRISVQFHVFDRAASGDIAHTRTLVADIQP